MYDGFDCEINEIVEVKYCTINGLNNCWIGFKDMTEDQWGDCFFELVEEVKPIIKQDIPYNERWGKW